MCIYIDVSLRQVGACPNCNRHILYPAWSPDANVAPSSRASPALRLGRAGVTKASGDVPELQSAHPLPSLEPQRQRRPLISYVPRPAAVIHT